MDNLHAALPQPLRPPARGFISSRPGKTWEEGLICGNGTLGANALSRTLDERIILTHERMFLPQGPPLMPPQDTGIRLFEIRQLIDRGLYLQATELAAALSGQDGFMYPDPFVPVCDLRVRMAARGDSTDYIRGVDFRTGEATVQWHDGRGLVERRLFVSRQDGIGVLALRCSEPGMVSCRIGLEPRAPSEQLDAKQVARSAEVFAARIAGNESTATNGELRFRSRFTNAYPGSIQAMDVVVRVETDGGTTSAGGNGALEIAGSDGVLLLVAVEPVYDAELPAADRLSAALHALPADYDRLLEPHARRHGALFDRMRLDLGGGDDHTRTTEDLLEACTHDSLNAALIEKEFDAGRYNIISCTGELPPTLQGVWGGTYVPGWASDYTHNGNVPSAIAANMMGNLPELMPAYTSYIESIVPWLEINARHMFGCRGVVLPSRSTTNGFNNALNPRFAGGFWVGGAGWAAHFFYDYYLYTGDVTFLADHALPFMEKALLFFEDYLCEGEDGRYVFSPTQSPENTPANSDSQGSFNATMDVAVARELLQNTIDASRLLDRNTDRIPIWETMLTKLPDYMIDDSGCIKEWLTPRLENNDNHRHSSQLYALYDGLPTEIACSPELRAAFRRSIEYKLGRHWQDNQRGFMSFGLVQLGQAATSLGDGDLAYHCLKHLVIRFWLSNLASMHNHRELFNMDISGGMPAVIIKMLVASEPGRISLLPALPPEWPTGTIEGVLCRGQVTIESLRWCPGSATIVLRSACDQTVDLQLPWPIEGVRVDRAPADTPDADSATFRLALTADRNVTVVLWRPGTSATG